MRNVCRNQLVLHVYTLLGPCLKSCAAVSISRHIKRTVPVTDDSSDLTADIAGMIKNAISTGKNVGNHNNTVLIRRETLRGAGRAS